MRIDFEIDGARAVGTIDGRRFIVTRNGRETSIDVNDEESFGGMVSGKLLSFCASVMDGINIIVDETDRLSVWEKIPEEITDEVYEALM